MLRRLPRIRKLSAFADGWAPKTRENGLKTPENGLKTPENGAKTPENGLKTPENGLPVVTRERVRQMHVQGPFFFSLFDLHLFPYWTIVKINTIFSISPFISVLFISKNRRQLCFFSK
jgi:hypothetical protein